MPIVSASVTWNGASFHLKLDTAEPVEAFRLQLQKLTGVPCAGQKIMGFPGGVLKACAWSDIALKGDRISVAMCGESVASSEVAPEAISSSSRVTVAIVTTQGAVISLPDLPSDCLVGRLKLMLSQPPHSCGAPSSLKLVYKGKRSVRMLVLGIVALFLCAIASHSFTFHPSFLELCIPA
jgi:hypothetical protein